MVAVTDTLATGDLQGDTGARQEEELLLDIEAGGVGPAAAAYHVVQYDTVVVIAPRQGGGHPHGAGAGVSQNQYLPLVHDLHNSLGLLAERSQVLEVLLVGLAWFPMVTDLRILHPIKRACYYN